MFSIIKVKVQFNIENDLGNSNWSEGYKLQCVK